MDDMVIVCENKEKFKKILSSITIDRVERLKGDKE